MLISGQYWGATALKASLKNLDLQGTQVQPDHLGLRSNMRNHLRCSRTVRLGHDINTSRGFCVHRQKQMPGPKQDKAGEAEVPRGAGRSGCLAPRGGILLANCPYVIGTVSFPETILVSTRTYTAHGFPLSYFSFSFSTDLLWPIDYYWT